VTVTTTSHREDRTGTAPCRRSATRRDASPVPLVCCRALLCAAGVLVVSLRAPAPAAAHGTPTPLAFWGGFGAPTARCQQAIGRIAAECALHVWQIRRECLDRELRGLVCDHDAENAAVDAAKINASSSVASACTEQQVANLVFLGVYEASSDVVTFCRELDHAATSAVTFPLPADPSAANADLRQCVSGTSHATTSLLHQAFVSRERVLDRIALGSFAPAAKNRMVTRSNARIASVAALLDATLRATCPPDAFARAYGRSSADLLAAIATRADCLAGRAYAQDRFTCPPSVCGNAMVEAGETCDDGNTVSGDGCDAQCQRE
jgi:cysteine-rich repeat protein